MNVNKIIIMFLALAAQLCGAAAPSNAAAETVEVNLSDRTQSFRSYSNEEEFSFEVVKTKQEVGKPHQNDNCIREMCV